MKRLIVVLLVLTSLLFTVITLYAQTDKPEIFVQTGHLGGFNVIDVSSDGKYAVTGKDEIIKLWNIPLKKEVRTIKSEKTVRAIQFSKDNKQVLTADYEGGIVVRDFKNWKIINKLNLNFNWLSDFHFLDEGEKALFTCNKIIRYWNVSENKSIFEFQNDSKEWVNYQKLAMSNSVKYIAAGGYIADYKKNLYTNIIDIIDISNGLIVKRLKLTPAESYNDLNNLTDIKWMQNDKYITATYANYDKDISEFKVWDVKTGEIIKSSSVDGVVHLNDGAGNYNILSLENGKHCGIFGILYDTKTWNKEKTLDHENGLLSDNSKYLYFPGFYGINIFDIMTQEVDSILPTNMIDNASSAEYLSKDKIFSQTDRNLIQWDLNSADPEILINDLFFNAVSKDKNYGVEFYSQKYTKGFGLSLWDIKKKELIHHWSDKQCEVDLDCLRFSSEGKYLIAASANASYDSHRGDFSLYAFDLQDFSIRKFEDNITGRLQNIIVSPDRSKIITLWTNDESLNKLTVSDLGSGKIINQFSSESYWGVIDISEDGRTVLIDGEDNCVVLQDIVAGNVLKKIYGHTDRITVIVFSSNDKFVSADNSGVIKVWDIGSGKEIRTIKTNTTNIKMLSMSPDREKLLYLSNEGTIRLCNIVTGREVAQFISFSDGEWIVITPLGYFNASPNGAKYINVRVGNQVYSIDNFYEKYYNPAYVASVLQGIEVQPVANIRDGVALPPVVRITSPETNSELKNEEVTITVSAKDIGGGIDEIRLYHNGKVVGEDTRGIRIVSKGKESTKSYTVTLVDGVNTFRAIGFSRDRTESNPSEIIIKLLAPEKEISMYVFAVGINKYKNPALNLNYAEPDAKGVVDFFRLNGKELFKKVEIRDIYNEQATKEGILAKLKELQNTNPQDAVLIYLAGHGENINEKWYFIPHELTYPEREEDVKTKAISSDELSDAIKNISAQKVLVVIDACKSGAVLLAFRGFEDRKALSQLSRSTGVHIIAASSKDQFAAEVKELGHGVFTYTLLEGLNGKAVNKGEIVTVRKLMSYIEEQLPELTKKYKQEAQYPVVDSRGMDFPLVRSK